MPINKSSQKPKKLTFNYNQFKLLQDYYAQQIKTHKTILARLDKLVEMLAVRTVNYRYSCHIDISRIKFEVTDPVNVCFIWLLNNTGGFDLSITIDDVVCNKVIVDNLESDIVYDGTKPVLGNSHRQATAFAKAMNALLSETAKIERVHAEHLQAAIHRIVPNSKPV